VTYDYRREFRIVPAGSGSYRVDHRFGPGCVGLKSIVEAQRWIETQATERAARMLLRGQQEEQRQERRRQRQESALEAALHDGCYSGMDTSDFRHSQKLPHRWHDPIIASCGLEGLGLAVALVQAWPEHPDAGGDDIPSDLIVPFDWPSVIGVLRSIGVTEEWALVRLYSFQAIGMIWLVQRGSDILQIQWRGAFYEVACR
jgi:hypothetical protein